MDSNSAASTILKKNYNNMSNRLREQCYELTKTV